MPLKYPRQLQGDGVRQEPIADAGGEVAVAFDTTQITRQSGLLPTERRRLVPSTSRPWAHPPAAAFRAAGQRRIQRPGEVSPPIAESDGGGSGVQTVMAFETRVARNGTGAPDGRLSSPLKAESGANRRQR